jgi:CRP-like cAMP-binding protein
VDVPLLGGLSEDKARRVLSSAHRRRFARNEVLFHEGDPAATVHLIVKGKVVVRVTTPLGDVVALDLALEGDVLGELALLAPDGIRSASAVALEPVETLTLDRDVFCDLREEDASVSEFLVQLLAHRVRKLNARLLEALYSPAETRICRRLLELADVYDDVIPLTQEDLAGLAGTTRATVNRVLRREEEKGAVALGRGRISVADRQALARRAR